MEQNLRTFKDFLQLYNHMTQTCFSHCVDNFKGRFLDTHEASCVDRCSTKLVEFNHRSIAVYAELQSKLMMKRQKELESQVPEEPIATDPVEPVT